MTVNYSIIVLLAIVMLVSLFSHLMVNIDVLECKSYKHVK